MIEFWVLFPKKAQNHHSFFFFFLYFAGLFKKCNKNKYDVESCLALRRSTPQRLFQLVSALAQTLARPWPNIHLGCIASAWDAAVEQQRHTYLDAYTHHNVQAYRHTHTHTHCKWEHSRWEGRCVFWTWCLWKHAKCLFPVTLSLTN